MDLLRRKGGGINYGNREQLGQNTNDYIMPGIGMNTECRPPIFMRAIQATHVTRLFLSVLMSYTIIPLHTK
jgi:hypothetical protein